MRQVVITKILCSTSVPGRGQVQAAECADGTLRVYIDGKLEPRAWTMSQLDDCLDTFLALSHSLRLGEKLSPSFRVESNGGSDQRNKKVGS